MLGNSPPTSLAMKLLAYTTLDGFETVTPLAAKSRNLGIVYSRHRPGYRLEMYVNRRGSRHFFAYKGSRDSDGHTAPESLTHTLCKTVLKQLADKELPTLLKATYKTEQQPPIALTLVSGVCEYPITANGREYVIDTFCHFRQPEASEWLQSHECRWSGRIAFEFFHTNGLSANHPKCRDLESVGIPVFQITVKAGSFFYIDEEELVDLDIEEAEERISLHCKKIANAFKKQIVGVLFNYPESTAFRNGRDLYGQLHAFEAQIRQLEAQKHHAAEQIDTLLSENTRLNKENSLYLNRLKSIHEIRHAENQDDEKRVQPSVQQRLPNKRPFWKRWFK